MQVWKVRLFEVKPNTRGESMLHHIDCTAVWAFGVPRSKPDREDTARVREPSGMIEEVCVGPDIRTKD
jgi:hypothetical protein